MGSWQHRRNPVEAARHVQSMLRCSSRGGAVTTYELHPVFRDSMRLALTQGYAGPSADVITHASMS